MKKFLAVFIGIVIFVIISMGFSGGGFQDEFNYFFKQTADTLDATKSGIYVGTGTDITYRGNFIGGITGDATNADSLGHKSPLHYVDTTDNKIIIDSIISKNNRVVIGIAGKDSLITTHIHFPDTSGSGRVANIEINDGALSIACVSGSRDLNITSGRKVQFISGGSSTFLLDDDLTVAYGIQFGSTSSTKEMIGTNLEQSYVRVDPRFDQTGTASGIGLCVDVIEKVFGSGGGEIFACRDNGTDKFTIDIDGSIQGCGTSRGSDTFGNAATADTVVFTGIASADYIFITFTVDPQADYWVSEVMTDTFVVSRDANAAGAATYDWFRMQ